MTPAELLLTPWTMDRALHVMRRSNGEHFINDSRMDDDQRQAMVDAINAGANIEALRQDAFELGVKSAGGSIIPDRSKFVELALDRDQIDILAALADDVVNDDAHRAYDSAPALKRFLETVSIFRRKR